MGKLKRYPDNWGPITKSIFIPPNIKVRAKLNNNYVGPFQGLTVYSQKDILKNIEEIQVLDGTIGTSETVLVCIGKLTVMVGHICTKNIPVSFLFRKKDSLDLLAN